MKDLNAYLALRNGTDVRGVAIDGVQNEPITLDNEAAKQIAKAFVFWLQDKLNKTSVTVSVGYDSRLSSPALSAAAIDGITEAGANAIATGLSTTPSMFMLLKDEARTKRFPCDGSIMITASHLPFNRNGLKFFCEAGGLEGGDVKEILTLAATALPAANAKGTVVSAPYLKDYANNLVKLVQTATGETTPLNGKKILVDAGNGAGGFFANDVLVPLGADVGGSQFLDPDGSFPNHIPNPENADAMRSVCEAVKRENADFGIIFDTDVDRAGAVDKGGEEINRNRLIALISAVLLQEKPGTIVTDSVTSDGLASFLTAKGGKHHRFKRGYKNVINEAIRLNNLGEYTPLAIETSGHAALKENYFLDDGAYLITRLLIALAKESKAGRTLTQLIADMPMPKEAKEVRVKFQPNVDFKTLGARVIEDYKAYATTRDGLVPATDNHEGYRVSYQGELGDGWVLLRMSLHDPILPINAESNTVGGTGKILRDIYEFLQHYDFLDLSPFHGKID